MLFDKFTQKRSKLASLQPWKCDLTFIFNSFGFSFLFDLCSSQFIPLSLTLSWSQSLISSTYRAPIHPSIHPSKHSAPAAAPACISSALIFLSGYRRMNDWSSQWPLQPICDPLSSSTPSNLSPSLFPCPLRLTRHRWPLQRPRLKGQVSFC